MQCSAIKSPDEEIAEMNRRIRRQAIRNLLVFIGVKAVVYYGLYRWSKSIRENV